LIYSFIKHPNPDR